MLIGLYQFALTSGIALADLVGYWFAASQGWRWMFAFGLVPAVFFLFMVLTVPESPRWLFAQNRSAEAESVLKSYTDEVGARLLLEDIRVSLMTKMERRWSALWSPAVRGSLFIAVGFMVLIPATGINAVLYYGPQIFSLAGISSNKSAIFATLPGCDYQCARDRDRPGAGRPCRPEASSLRGRWRHDGRAVCAFRLLFTGRPRWGRPWASSPPPA